MSNRNPKQASNLLTILLLASVTAFTGRLATEVSNAPRFAAKLRSIAQAIRTAADDTLDWAHFPNRNLRTCESNLKNIATALEMYSTDNAGRYPNSLNLLVPNYLTRIPKCPSAGTDTYSTSLQSRANPDAFTIYCSGSNHGWAKAPANYPEYDNTTSH